MKQLIFAALLLIATAVSAQSLPDKTITFGKSSTHYVEDGNGPVVVLVHGNGGSYKDMLTVLNDMVHLGYHVYALDSRGQGQNAPLSEYHYADIMEDVYGFIKALNLSDVSVLGFSDGGIIAIELAMAHPECLHAIAACGANTKPDGLRPDVLESSRKEVEKARKENRKLEPLNQMMVDEPQISADQLMDIHVPAIIMAGENDLIAEDHTRYIAACIPNARLDILPGEGHGSYIYNGRAALRFVDFLRSLKKK